MANSGRRRVNKAIRALLGLPDSAGRGRIRSQAQKLRGHIEGRLAAAPTEEFADARRREAARLVDELAREGLQIGPRGGRPWLWGGVGLLLGAAAASLGFLAIPPAANEQARQHVAPGQISVGAEPENASWILFDRQDDRVIAQGPADGRAYSLAQGPYRLRVEHGDCPDEWEREIEIASGEERHYSPRLCQGEGELVVESNAEGARLKIDGLDVGTTGPGEYRVPAGAHTVRVEKEGFEPWEGKIQVRAEQVLALRAELSPGPAECRPTPPGSSDGAPPAAPDRKPSQTPPSAGPRPSRGSGGAVGGGDPTEYRPSTGKGGSKSWHEAVRHQLVSDYDRNASRSLDTREEIESIPCPVLLNLEASYESGGLAVEMTHLYGFDGSDAPANTLGVTPGIRSYAFDRMKACGLKTRH